MMNNVNNLNMDFIYNYIHWASCCSLYFPQCCDGRQRDEEVKVPREGSEDGIQSEDNDYLICD